MFYRAITSRLFHTVNPCFSAAASTSSLLGKLRKATGYSMSNCKKSLEMFPNDIQKAEEWLHAEAKKLGWSKWNKIQNRSAAQGLIGVYSNDTLGIMVEVNCETDFVARNTEFQQLVGHVLSSFLENNQHFDKGSNEGVQKHLLEGEEILNLKYQSSTIRELLNAAMCKFNEKTVLKRVAILKTSDSTRLGVSSLTHPVHSCPNLPNAAIGKFGALVAYRQKPESEEDLETVGSNICQHIIGMNPTSIGQEDFLELFKAGKIHMGNTENMNINTEKENVSEDNAEEVEDSFKSDLKDSDESRLLFQPYLLDPSLRVYDYTVKQAEIVDFERFECGCDAKAVVEEAESVANIRQ